MREKQAYQVGVFMKKRSLLFATIVVITLATVSNTVLAYVVAGSMGRDPVSSQGQCLKKTDSKTGKAIGGLVARQILKRNSITTTANASEGELVALAIGVHRIEELHGKPFEGTKGAHYIYTQASRVWNQHAGPIHVNRNWSKHTGMHSENIGMLMHELGHYVGNNKNPLNTASYAKYFRAVPQPCYFSWYAKQSRNEEFADVFATFIMNPNNLLKFGSASCKRAYDFFRKEVFSKGKMTTCSASSAGSGGGGFFDWN